MGRRGEVPRTLLWYKLTRFYGLSASLRIFRLREPSCGPIDYDSAGYLTESIASYTDTLLHGSDVFTAAHVPEL